MKGTVLRSRSDEEKSELAKGFIDDVIPLFISGELRSLCQERYPVEDSSGSRPNGANLTFGKLRDAGNEWGDGTYDLSKVAPSGSSNIAVAGVPR